MKQLKILSLLLLIFLLCSCWQPNYNAGSSNSVYFLEKMSYRGEVNIQNLQDIYMGIDNNNLYVANTGLKLSPTGNHGYLFSFNQITPMELKGESWKRIGYTDTEGFFQSFEPFYISDNSSSYYMSNYIMRPINDQNSSTIDSILLVHRNNHDGTTNTTPTNYGLITSSSGSPYTWVDSTQNNNDIEFLTGTLYTPLDGSEDRMITVSHLASDGLIGLYDMDPEDLTDRNLLQTVMDYGSGSEVINLPSDLDIFSSRTAYDPVNKIFVLSDMGREPYESYALYLNEITTMTEDSFHFIGGLGKQDHVKVCLSNGYFLFQGKLSEDNFSLGLWKPGTTPVSLSMGRLFYMDKYSINGEELLTFNYYINTEYNGERTQILKIFTISEKELMNCFGL